MGVFGGFGDFFEGVPGLAFGALAEPLGVHGAAVAAEEVGACFSHEGIVGELWRRARGSYIVVMSPTVFRDGPYRFFFFSREEPRPHVHVNCAEGEAKFWISPAVALATSVGLTKKQLNQLEKTIKERRDEINEAWKEHFKS